MRKKNSKKEMFILILLFILIMLILAVSLYDYIPSNISIPETISYSSDSTTTSIKQEIAYTNGGDATIDLDQSDADLVTSLKSYHINSSDLTVYGQKNLYNSGNSNPFDYAEEATENDASQDGNGSQPTGGSAANGSTQKSSSTGTFFEKSTSK